VKTNDFRTIAHDLDSGAPHAGSPPAEQQLIVIAAEPRRRCRATEAGPGHCAPMAVQARGLEAAAQRPPSPA